MTVVDLTNERPSSELRVAMITRFPPSRSASAPTSSRLAQALANRHGFGVEVIRLMSTGEEPAFGGPVVMDLNPFWDMSARLAAERANDCDVAMVRFDRHVPPPLIEACMSELSVPVILTVDDVGPEESVEMSLLGDWAMRVDTLVVPSHTARQRLESQVDGSAKIAVIPHGSPWRAMRLRTAPRRRILTWGFLGPGIGAERIVRAMALLKDLEPRPRYKLVGVADPAWPPREAATYRASLMSAARRFGIADQVEMVPLLQPLESLAGDIAKSDLVAVIYDSKDRSASRLLNEGVSTGRPVVATAFPGAIEMLSSGAGITVVHDDDQAMADALRLYMTNDGEYRRAASVASRLSQGLSCDEVARRFALLLTGRLREPQFVAKSTP